MAFFTDKPTGGERRGIIALLIIIISIIAIISLCSRKPNSASIVNPIADTTLSTISNDTIPAQKNEKKSRRKKIKANKSAKKSWTPRDPLSEPLPHHNK